MAIVTQSQEFRRLSEKLDGKGELRITLLLYSSLIRIVHFSSPSCILSRDKFARTSVS